MIKVRCFIPKSILEINRVKLGGYGIDFSGIAEADGAGIFSIISSGRPSKSTPQPPRASGNSHAVLTSNTFFEFIRWI